MPSRRRVEQRQHRRRIEKQGSDNHEPSPADIAAEASRYTAARTDQMIDHDLFPAIGYASILAPITQLCAPSGAKSKMSDDCLRKMTWCKRCDGHRATVWSGKRKTGAS
jgi:hypothetical protein